MGRRKQDTNTRFWSMVQKSDGCWLWTGGTVTGGYGHFFTGRCWIRSHRFAYQLLVGPIPKGLQLDHLCKNVICVNPAHLEPVTPRENILRSSNWAAINARKQECVHGHPFDEKNTGIRPNGARRCRACYRRYRKNYYATHREEVLRKNASRTRKYYLAHSEAIRARVRDYQKKNREAIAIRKHERYLLDRAAGRR